MSEMICLEFRNVAQCHAWLEERKAYFDDLLAQFPLERDHFLRHAAGLSEFRQIIRNWRNSRTRISRNQIAGLSLTVAELPWGREHHGTAWDFFLAMLDAMSRPDPFPLLNVIDLRARQVQFQPEIAVSHCN